MFSTLDSVCTNLKCNRLMKLPPPRLPKPKTVKTASPSWITLWLLFVAPGQLMRFAIPYSPAEVVRRLGSEGAIVKAMQSGARTGYTVVLHLPGSRTERNFSGWIEPDGMANNRTWLTGQTRTSYRSALSRLVIISVLIALGLFFISSERIAWGGLFLIGCLGYLLLAQYERLTGRDRRLYAAWLREILHAQPVATR